MEFQDRDKLILENIYKFQCLTSAQISRLFSMNIKITQRRLRKLCNSGFIEKTPIPSTKQGNTPYLYYLGSEAAALFNVAASKPRFNFQMTHQQKNSDLLIDSILYLKSTELEFEVMPEHLIRTGKHDKILIPDGALMLGKNDKKALFFIENCLGTEIIKSPTHNADIESKIIRYADMFKNDDTKFYKNYFSYQFKRFRVLFITNTAQRLDAISKIVKEHDKQGFILMTTLPDFNKKGICNKIWYVPVSNRFEQSII